MFTNDRARAEIPVSMLTYDRAKAELAVSVFTYDRATAELDKKFRNSCRTKERVRVGFQFSFLQSSDMS